MNEIDATSIEELNKSIPDPIQFAYDPLVEYLDALNGPSLSNDTLREAVLKTFNYMLYLILLLGPRARE